MCKGPHVRATDCLFLRHLEHMRHCHCLFLALPADLINLRIFSNVVYFTSRWVRGSWAAGPPPVAAHIMYANTSCPSLPNPLHLPVSPWGLFHHVWQVITHLFHEPR